MTRDIGCTAEEAFEHVSDGCVVVDSSWTVEAVDEGFEELLDVDADDVVGRSFWSSLPVDRDGDLGGRLHGSMESSSLSEFECYHEELDNWFRVFCCPVEDRFNIYLRDITREKEAHRRVERMNESLLLLNRIVRHDVRNDMAVVQGWSEELRGYVDGEGEEILDRVIDTTRHAIRLTESARDYVEVLTEGGSTELEAVSLKPVLEDELERCRSMYGDASIESAEIPDVDVRGNALLSSVFNNVVGNAVEHNDTDRPNVDVHVEVEDDFVRVEVSDDGPGVPEERRDDVFGRGLEGLDAPAAGLGLHLVDRVVRGYGGDVWIEGNEPRGAVFVLKLPLAATEGGGDGV